MKLVIVQGGAATGKTTIAKYLAKSLGYNTFLKDEYKEKEFDKVLKKLNLVQWFRLEEESYQAIYKAIESAIKNNKNLIVEGNFLPHRKNRIKKLLKSNNDVREVYCQSKGRTTIKRFIHRNEKEDRHKGHKDRLWYPMVFLESIFAEVGIRWYRPLKLSDKTIKIDTTDTEKIDYQKLIEFVQTN